MCVDQTEGRVQLKEWQDEDRWRRHTIGKQPKEEMLVPQKFITRESIGGRQRNTDGDNHVHHYVGKRIDVTVIPRRIGKNSDVVVQREVLWPQCKRGQDLLIGLKTHVQQPIQRQHQKDYIGGDASALNFEHAIRRDRHYCAPGPLIWLIIVVARHHRVENPANQKNDEEIDKRHSRSRAQIKLTHRHLYEIDREKGRDITWPSPGHHKRLGVDHEGVHKAQQNRNQQHTLYLRQLYEAKYRPA